MANRAQAGPRIDEVVDAVLAAERIHDTQNAAFGILQSLESVLGIRPHLIHLLPPFV